MGMSPTLPMIGPDGTAALIPHDQTQAAANAGAKPALKMYGPDGSPSYIPLANVGAALKAGAMTEGQYQQKNSPPPTVGPTYTQEMNRDYATSPSDSLPVTALKSAAGTIGSPFVHPLSALSGLMHSVTPDSGMAGIAESALGPAGPMLTHLIGGAAKQASADNQQGGWGYAVSKLAGNVAGNAVLAGGTAGIAKGLGAATDLLPSTARAGETFNSLKTDLADNPVPLDKTLAPLQRATELGVRGRTLPGPVKALLERSQAIEPMTYPEARDYQSALSDMSANDKMSMSGSMKGQVSKLSQGFFDDIKSAADAAGRGDDYAQAMKEYRQASSLQDSAKAAMKLALVAGGGYKAYTVFKSLMGGS